MPELPEVETIARSLRPQLIGRKIIEADVRWARTVAMPSVKKFKEQVKGQKIVECFAPRKIPEHSTPGLQSPNTSPHERRCAGQAR